MSRFPTITGTSIAIDVHLGPEEWAASLLSDARRGLTSVPKTLPPTWLYDDVGSALYDEITRLPEYYPARTEQSILDRSAGQIIALAGADVLVELGSGTSEKTRPILDAMRRHGALQRYVPFDVSEGTLRHAAQSIYAEYEIDVHGVVGDFRRHLAFIPSGGSRLIAFLGGTIGNLDRIERRHLLGDLTATMRPGDTFLVGTDLVKDRSRLVRAYDDAAGLTAAFNKNVLSMLNHELQATFDLDDFDHVALFDEGNEWIEMRLRARRAHVVEVPGLGLHLSFEAGEEIRTEISTKFRAGNVCAELAAVGLTVREMWTDPAGDFALTLAAC